MDEQILIIEGYQPTVKVQDGYQSTAGQKGKSKSVPVSTTPVAMVKVIPPQGGTGETVLRRSK